MSFDLAVWDSHVAVTNAEADEIYAKLCEGQPLAGLPSPAIQSFYTELIAKWPEIDTVAKENLDDLRISAHGLAPFTAPGGTWSCRAFGRGPKRFGPLSNLWLTNTGSFSSILRPVRPA